MKPEYKTMIRWYSAVGIVLIICATLYGLSKQVYTIRIEANPEVKEIATKYADTMVQMEAINQNCTSEQNNQQETTPLDFILGACRYGCEYSFDEIAGANAIAIGDFYRSSCVDICVKKYLTGDSQ